MLLHKKFIDEIIKQRNATLGDIVEKGMQLRNKSICAEDLIAPLDSIYFTLEFLRKEGFVEVNEKQNLSVPSLFKLPSSYDLEKINAVSFHCEEFNKRYDWNIKIRPGLINFREQGYKTDNQITEDKHFWLAIAVAVLASYLTALFTNYL